MQHDVTMPQLGMAQDAGKIVSWLKAPGDKIAKGDALFEVETDKATMEVEAQASGFLTHVTAAEGEDVPVGQAIARISDSPDAADDAPVPIAPAPAARSPDAPAQDDLPEGRQITMPQLGMAQDSGVLVGWLKSLGDVVDADDILFEVETDKSTMEVPAGQTGYLAATLANAGEEVPVGAALAIISAQKPDAPVARSAAADATPQPQTAPAAASAPKPTQSAAAEPARAPQVTAPRPGDRILASPKLRRVALEQGLDLARLVQAGHPQPYHMRDLDVLRSLKDPQTNAAPTTTMAAQTIRLQAECDADGFADFATWAATSQGMTDADALWAGLAGASLGEKAAIVGVERFGTLRAFHVPAGRRLSSVTPTDAPPDLLLRDLRATPLCGVCIGAESTPVLSILQQDAGLALVLECRPDQLDGPRAIALISAFAGRMQDPLQHLL